MPGGTMGLAGLGGAAGADAPGAPDAAADPAGIGAPCAGAAPTLVSPCHRPTEAKMEGAMRERQLDPTLVEVCLLMDSPVDSSMALVDAPNTRTMTSNGAHMLRARISFSYGATIRKAQITSSAAKNP